MNQSHPHDEVDVCLCASDWKQGEGDFQIAVLHALERNTKTRWRAVCANIMVECSEPYRSLVLRREVVESLRAQQHNFSCDRNHEAAVFNYPEIFLVKAEMHTPLIENEQASVMFKRSASFLSSAF